MNIHGNTHLVKSLATELGFSFCGISKAEFLEEEAPKLEEWLKRGYQGEMGYLENHFDKRLDLKFISKLSFHLHKYKNYWQNRYDF